MNLGDKLAKMEGRMRERIGKCPKCFNLGLLSVTLYPPPLQPPVCPACGRVYGSVILNDHH
jgi:hypothetical protein